jgi:hypothetical protein
MAENKMDRKTPKQSKELKDCKQGKNETHTD